MQSLRSEKGLTLVEIIVVLIILSVVMVFFGNKILGAGDQAKADLTKLMMKEYSKVLSNSGFDTTNFLAVSKP